MAYLMVLTMRMILHNQLTDKANQTKSCMYVCMCVHIQCMYVCMYVPMCLLHHPLYVLYACMRPVSTFNN